MTRNRKMNLFTFQFRKLFYNLSSKNYLPNTKLITKNLNRKIIAETNGTLNYIRYISLYEFQIYKNGVFSNPHPNVNIIYSFYKATDMNKLKSKIQQILSINKKTLENSINAFVSEMQPFEIYRIKQVHNFPFHASVYEMDVYFYALSRLMRSNHKNIQFVSQSMFRKMSQTEINFKALLTTSYTKEVFSLKKQLLQKIDALPEEKRDELNKKHGDIKLKISFFDKLHQVFKEYAIKDAFIKTQMLSPSQSFLYYTNVTNFGYTIIPKSLFNRETKHYLYLEDRYKSQRKTFDKFKAYSIQRDSELFWNTAISVDPTPLKGGGYRVFIHVADVTSYFDFDSIVNYFALKQSSAIKFPFHNTTIFPEKFANVMSILEGKINRVISFEIELDARGEIKRHNICYGSLSNVVCMTEKEADELLLKSSGSKLKKSEDKSDLKLLLKLSALISKRYKYIFHMYPQTKLTKKTHSHPTDSNGDFLPVSSCGFEFRLHRDLLVNPMLNNLSFLANYLSCLKIGETEEHNYSMQKVYPSESKTSIPTEKEFMLFRSRLLFSKEKNVQKITFNIVTSPLEKSLNIINHFVLKSSLDGGKKPFSADFWNIYIYFYKKNQRKIGNLNEISNRDIYKKITIEKLRNFEKVEVKLIKKQKNCFVDKNNIHLFFNDKRCNKMSNGDIFKADWRINQNDKLEFGKVEKLETPMKIMKLREIYMNKTYKDYVQEEFGIKFDESDKENIKDK